MGTDPGAALAEIVEDVADELGEASPTVDDGVTSWVRGGVAFARVSTDTLEVRLPADIAEAALRTPDTAPIDGKPGWIRFRPSSDERHVADRAEAWFHTAWRHARDAG